MGIEGLGDKILSGLGLSHKATVTKNIDKETGKGTLTVQTGRIPTQEIPNLIEALEKKYGVKVEGYQVSGMGTPQEKITFQVRSGGPLLDVGAALSGEPDNVVRY